MTKILGGSTLAGHTFLGLGALLTSAKVKPCNNYIFLSLALIVETESQCNKFVA